MQYEIERTRLHRGNDVQSSFGVQHFEERAASVDELLARVAARDRGVISGETIRMGRETLATLRSPEGLFLLRVSAKGS